MLFFAHVGLTLASSRLLPRADLACIALGSMLPDIIDKPLGLILFGSPEMGRTVAHTLLFLLFLSILSTLPALSNLSNLSTLPTLAALSLHRLDLRYASITWGVFIHLLLDGMYNSPQTLLWPLLGPFPAAELMDTYSYIEMLLSGLNDPSILIPELSGLLYIIFLAYDGTYHRLSEQI